MCKQVAAFNILSCCQHELFVISSSRTHRYCPPEVGALAMSAGRRGTSESRKDSHAGHLCHG